MSATREERNEHIGMLQPPIISNTILGEGLVEAHQMLLTSAFPKAFLV